MGECCATYIEQNGQFLNVGQEFLCPQCECAWIKLDDGLYDVVNFNPTNVSLN